MAASRPLHTGTLHMHMPGLMQVCNAACCYEIELCDWAAEQNKSKALFQGASLSEKLSSNSKGDVVSEKNTPKLPHCGLHWHAEQQISSGQGEAKHQIVVPMKTKMHVQRHWTCSMGGESSLVTLRPLCCVHGPISLLALL